MKRCCHMATAVQRLLSQFIFIPPPAYICSLWIDRWFAFFLLITSASMCCLSLCLHAVCGSVFCEAERERESARAHLCRNAGIYSGNREHVSCSLKFFSSQLWVLEDRLQKHYPKQENIEWCIMSTMNGFSLLTILFSFAFFNDTKVQLSFLQSTLLGAI